MDFELTDEQRAFQHVARDFAQHQLRNGHLSRADGLSRAGVRGFCGLYAPAAAGGLASTRLDATLVLEELATVCPDTAVALNLHNIATWIVATLADRSVAGEWAAPLASGCQIATIVLPDLDPLSSPWSPPFAHREGDHYVVGAGLPPGTREADAVVHMVRTGGTGPCGWTALLVTRELLAGEVLRVPMRHCLGTEGGGHAIAVQAVEAARIGIAACSVGAAQGSLDATCHELQARRRAGRGGPDLHALNLRAADLATELTAARQMVRLAASKLDRQDREAGVHAAMAKRFAGDVAFDICHQALQMHAGERPLGRWLPPESREDPGRVTLERLLGAAREHRGVAGGSEALRQLVARRLLQDGAGEGLR